MLSRLIIGIIYFLSWLYLTRQWIKSFIPFLYEYYPNMGSNEKIFFNFFNVIIFSTILIGAIGFVDYIFLSCKH
jgi:hypothetical protein